MARPRFPIEVRARKGRPLGMPPARFLRDFWQKHPLLIRNAFPGFNPPLTPDDLAGLACMEGALARIVTRTPGTSSFRGRRRAQPAKGPGLRLQDCKRERRRRPEGRAPGMARVIHLAVSSKSKMDPGLCRDDVKRTAATASREDCRDVRSGSFDDATFAKLPKSHWTLLVQDVDKWDADTAALLDTFAFIPDWRIDDVMVSYASDQGGVGAHVDQYDVFLLQGLGQRRWAIDARANPPTDFREGAELKLLQHFHPTHAWTLEPGDMLYLPPGVPHDGIAVGECMTFSIGMRAPSTAEMLVDLAHFIAGRLPEERRYADPDLRVVLESGEIDAAAMARVARAMPWVRLGPEDKKPKQKRRGNVESFAHEVPASLLRTWFGCFITRYRAAQAPASRKRPIDRARLAKRLPHSVLERDPWSRFAWCRQGRDATLFATGDAFDAPLVWARTLASPAHVFDGTQLVRLPQRARGIALLAALIDAGHIRLRRR